MTTTRHPQPHGHACARSQPRRWLRHQPGYTLLELLVVLAIVALATAAATISLPDSAAVALEREASRLASLLESARARSRASGTPVVWTPTADGFRWQGPAPAAATGWLEAGTTATTAAPVVLGPEPIIAPQAIELHHRDAGERAVVVRTDGLHPFRVDTGS